MTNLQNLVIESANRLFSDISGRDLWSSTEEGVWPEKEWQAIAELGLVQAMVPDEEGPSPAEVLPLAELAGYHALPLPLPETIVANYLLSKAGLPTSDEPLALASSQKPIRLFRSEGQWQVSGEIRRINWGRRVSRVLLQVQTDSSPALISLPAEGLDWHADINLAGEPRDTYQLDCVKINTEDFAMYPESEPSLQEWGALVRALQMAGASRRVLELSVQYANERVQFGRPIGKFQAVQQQLASAAGQVAAAGAAANAAIRQLESEGLEFAIAIAKARTGEAAGLIAAVGHQVHGAMGYTQEHTLHYSTRRLWSWRDEFGNEAYWQNKIGALAAKEGRDGLWPLLTILK